MKSRWLSDIIQPVIMDLGYDFWGYHYISQGKHSLLQVYIDSEDGITVDDCKRVSEQLGAALDVEDPVRDHYVLEVSSPGVQRPLFTLEQYQRYRGHEVSVKVRVLINNQRNFKGKLIEVTDDDLTLEMGEKQIVLPMSGIEKAKLLDEAWL